MKLKIAQDRIRFRLSDDELRALTEGHSLRVSVCAPWSRDVRLLDCEVGAKDSEAASLEVDASRWHLQIARADLMKWFESRGVSFKIDTPSGLELVIERDLGRKAKRSEDSLKGESV